MWTRNQPPLNEEEFEEWFQNTDLGGLIPTEGGIVVPVFLERKRPNPCQDDSDVPLEKTC